MKATKGNKTYTIAEQDKKRYQDAGFDIQDDSGKVIAYGKGKTVSYEAFAKLEAENKDLQVENKTLRAECEALREVVNSAQNAVKDLKDMTVEELTAYVAEKQIDIGRATSKEGILEKIREAESTGR